MKINKQLCDELAGIKGEICGAVLSIDMHYILNNGTSSDLQIIQERSKALGHAIDYTKIKDSEWYSLGRRLVSFLLVVQHFKLDDMGIRNMGKFAPNVSPMVRLYLKYFGNGNIFSKKMPLYWKKHYTVGKLELVKMDEVEGALVAHILDFYHSINDINKEVGRLYVLRYLEGYFETITKLVFGETEGKMREIIDSESHYYEFSAKFTPRD